MTFQAERKLIETHVQDNFTQTPVKFDNIPFNQPNATPFVSLSILSGTGVNTSIGPNPVQRYTGIVQLDIYVPEDTGTAEARDIASSLRSLFNNQQLTDISSGTSVICAAPSLNRVAKSPNGKYRVTVTVPYRLLP